MNFESSQNGVTGRGGFGSGPQGRVAPVVSGGGSGVVIDGGAIVTGVGIETRAAEGEGVKEEFEWVTGPLGRIEAVTVEARNGSAQRGVMYFLPGWWGSLSDYHEVLRFFAGLGYRCRCFSWRGTGRSEGSSFWGFWYEGDLMAVVNHFRDEEVIAVPHSGAIDPVRTAIPLMAGAGFQPIRTAIFIAPLARSGSMNALWTWLRPDGSGTNVRRLIRFLGSNCFGVDWFMRNELAVRRVLMSDEAPQEDVERVMRQIDNCPFGRYFLSLWRFPKWVQHAPMRLADYGVERSIVLRAELDRNFTRKQQKETAEALGAEYEELPGTCHQWFAEERSFGVTVGAVLRWLGES